MTTPWPEPARESAKERIDAYGRARRASRDPSNDDAHRWAAGNRVTQLQEEMASDLQLALDEIERLEGEKIEVSSTSGKSRLAFRRGTADEYVKLVLDENERLEAELAAASEEVKATWHAMQGVGQLEAYRILERMVRRLGYRDMRDPSLAAKGASE